MPLELVPIRCLTSNYAYLIHGGGQTALIDAPEAAPILRELQQRGWSLDHILLTHHHPDHVQAVPELVGATGAQVWGNENDAARLPPLDQPFHPGDHLNLCGTTAEVIDVPGHTIGHVAFHFPGDKLAFTADSLMAIGCGRLFEGTPAQMWASLTRLNKLPGETLICSGHDYTESNGAFALSVDPANEALKVRVAETTAGRIPASPATLDQERATNPFLRPAQLRDGLEMHDFGNEAVFTRLRAMKDAF